MKKIPSLKEKWCSVPEIAYYLGVSEIMIYRLLKKNKIPAHRVGVQWRMKTDEIDDWVKRGDAKFED